MEKPEVTYLTEIDDKKGIETINIKFQLPKMDIIYHIFAVVGRYSSSIECSKQCKKVPLISEVIVSSGGMANQISYEIKVFRHTYLLVIREANMFLLAGDSTGVIFEHLFEIERGE